MEGWFVTYRQSRLQGTLLSMGIGADLVEHPMGTEGLGTGSTS